MLQGFSLMLRYKLSPPHSNVVKKEEEEEEGNHQCLHVQLQFDNNGKNAGNKLKTDSYIFNTNACFTKMSSQIEHML